MKKIIFISALTVLVYPMIAFAVCPVCTVAVGTGLGLAEWLGIDDSISGLWIGALIVSMSLWTIKWLDKKGIRFKGRKVSVFAAYYLIVVGPLWIKGTIGHPLNTVCGVDKLLLGIISGSILFAAGAIFHDYLRRRNGGKSHFKGQKIALPVSLLMIASAILYFTC